MVPFSLLALPSLPDALFAYQLCSLVPVPERVTEKCINLVQVFHNVVLFWAPSLLMNAHVPPGFVIVLVDSVLLIEIVWYLYPLVLRGMPDSETRFNEAVFEGLSVTVILRHDSQNFAGFKINVTWHLKFYDKDPGIVCGPSYLLMFIIVHKEFNLSINSAYVSHFSSTLSLSSINTC